MAKVAPHISEILSKYDIAAKDALWDCHGTLVMYHRYCEIIAAKAGIQFDPPTVIEASGASKTVAICVLGKMGERREWSIGEASPANNKNSYPYAMAEKRAKDRVILKLAGLSGFVYSEEEADDFKSSERRAVADEAPAKANDDWKLWADDMSARIAKSKTARDLDAVVADNKEQFDQAPELVKSSLRDQYQQRLIYHKRSAAA